MIVSKPKNGTLISLSLFLILVAALTAATFSSIEKNQDVFWYHWVFLTILIPSFFAVLIKILIGYKKTSFGKGKITVTHPIRFKRKEYSVKDINQWEEVKIKTASGLYQQLEIVFNNDEKFTLGKQEHSNYEQAVRYLKQKAGRKQIS